MKKGKFCIDIVESITDTSGEVDKSFTRAREKVRGRAWTGMESKVLSKLITIKSMIKRNVVETHHDPW